MIDKLDVMLKSIFIFLYCITLLFAHTFALADIYSWVDENGVRSYSNTLPPKGIEAKQEAEIPFDEAAYEARRSAERQARIHREIQFEAERNDRLMEQLEQAKQMLEQLELKTQEALDNAQKARQAAKKQPKQRRIYPCFPYPAPYPGLKPYPGLRPYPGLAPYPGFKTHSNIQIPSSSKRLDHSEMLDIWFYHQEARRFLPGQAAVPCWPTNYSNPQPIAKY